jgi:hypothetical protein
LEFSDIFINPALDVLMQHCQSLILLTLQQVSKAEHCYVFGDFRGRVSRLT